MKNIILIGARGMGRTIHNWFEECMGYNVDFKIKGFLDDDYDALLGFENYAPILNSVEEYQICSDDFFICTLGDIPYKKKYTQLIINKGGKFFTFIHPLARIMKDVKIGEGTIIGPWTSVGSGALISNYCLIQTFAVIGHDVQIGNWSRIDTHGVCSGGARIGNSVTVHTGAIINQKVTIEDEAKVGAGSFVIKNVKRGNTVIGNPAKILKF